MNNSIMIAVFNITFLIIELGIGICYNIVFEKLYLNFILLLEY